MRAGAVEGALTPALSRREREKERPAGFAGLALYWLLALITGFDAMLSFSWFLLSGNILLSIIVLQWPLRYLTRALALISLVAILVYFLLSDPEMTAAFIPLAISINLLTVFILLLRSHRLFGFDPDRNAALRRQFMLLMTAMAIIGVPACFVLNLLGHYRPFTYDPSLYYIEVRLGNPSLWMGGRFHEHPWFAQLCTMIYDTLPAWLFAACYIQQQKEKATAVNVAAVILAISAGCIGYFILPAVGPRSFYGHLWPFTPLHGMDTGTQSYFAPDIVRNCMPSLHTAWVMAAWLAARRFSTGCFLFFSFIAAATLIATLGLGEHYLVDLVVAIPYTAALWIGFDHSVTLKAKLPVIALCCALVILWFAGLMTGWLAMQNITLLWAFIGFSVIFPLWVVAPGRNKFPFPARRPHA